MNNWENELYKGHLKRKSFRRDLDKVAIYLTECYKLSLAKGWSVDDIVGKSRKDTRLQDLFTMFVIEGKTVTEIAEETGYTVNHIKNLLFGRSGSVYSSLSYNMGKMIRKARVQDEE